ncbi:ubiquitin-transferase domain-containing protein, putative [Eimeria necatrix]|uniref:HECT-type E3 ubiquitin transferase n=1 Tax=Eimeria necatrix TaxID=51315 RepID=U6MYV0_9EIME|nr:ubiquitin-transferase domain-containing protein, putative [Eimeria necatrix]CDJ67664.1 ubiquitin-transferase domain-containing protein, putative [Eimeria necatrix]
MYEWGSSIGTRNVNLSGGQRNSTALGRSAFLRQTRERREQRERQRRQQQAQHRISGAWRAFRERQKCKQLCRDEFDRQRQQLQLQLQEQQLQQHLIAQVDDLEHQRQQLQQQQVHKQQARRIAFSFDPFCGAGAADAERLLAAAFAMPAPSIAAATVPENKAGAGEPVPSCALHVALLRALSVHYRNLLLLQHSSELKCEHQQQQQRRCPPHLLFEGDLRYRCGWRCSALSPSGRACFGLPAAVPEPALGAAGATLASFGAAAAKACRHTAVVGRLPLMLLPLECDSSTRQQAKACAAATSRLLVQLLRFDMHRQQQLQQPQPQQQKSLFHSAVWRLLGLGCCIAAQIGYFVSSVVTEPAAAAAIAANGHSAAQMDTAADAEDALILLEHFLRDQAFNSGMATAIPCCWFPHHFRVPNICHQDATISSTAAATAAAASPGTLVFPPLSRVCNLRGVQKYCMAQTELLLHLFGSPLLLPSFAAKDQQLQQHSILQDRAVARLEAILFGTAATPAAADAPDAAEAASTAAAAPRTTTSLAVFPELRSAGAIVAAASAAAALRRRLGSPGLLQNALQQRQHFTGLQQENQLKLASRQELLRLFAAECERLDGLYEGLRRPYPLRRRATAPDSATAPTEGDRNMGLGVCLAGNMLSLFHLHRQRLVASGTAAAAQQAASEAAEAITAPVSAALTCPVWLLASLRLCGWSCPFDLLRASLLSPEEQRGQHQQQQQKDRQTVLPFSVSVDEALRRQLVVLTEGWAVDAFFTAAQAAPPRGLSDLLQLYLPPESERAAAASSAAAAAAASPATGDATAAEDETESESDSETEDDGGSGEDFRNLWDHKYTDDERLILNALSVSTPLPLRLLNAIRTCLDKKCGGSADTFFGLMGHPPEFTSEWGEAVRSLCTVLRYKLQMTDDSELLEETEEEQLNAGNSTSSTSACKYDGSINSGFSLKRSDLRWLLLTLNRVAWLLLRSTCASSCPQQRQQQQQQEQQELSLLLPEPPYNNSSSSSNGRRWRRGRERLWQLVPGVLRELLDLNSRVSLVEDEELVLPDGPASLIFSAAGGQRLPALWECLVWCMRGGDAAAASTADAATVGGSSSIATAPSAASRGPSRVPPPGLRLSNLPTRLLASSLVYVPHTIAFSDRLAVFYQLLAFERGDSSSSFFYRRCFQIRRTHIDVMRGFQVEFITAEGTPEAGIDGGGLLKELIVELSRRAFDPAYGLFHGCPDNSLFPNPSVELLHPNFANLFLAIGRLVGKAVFEGVLIEPQLNRVFLKLLLRRPCRLDDIKSLDPSVHRSLMLLKKYPGDAAELSLTFSVMRSEFGSQEEVDLIPNGCNIPVTNASKLRYVQLMSDYKCVKQIQQQTQAFLRGLSDVVPLQWLQMFSAEELQHLVSGTSEGFDVEDLRSHASYSGGFSETSPQVLWLWELLSGMADSERSSFLMFVTSCSRAPLRGFGSLSPPFTIHRVPDTSRLPTSSTCVNLFKLPAYATRKDLWDKVRGAIGGTRGFGLS